MNNIKNKLLIFCTFFLVFVLPLVYSGSRLYPHISLKIFFFYGVVEVIFSLWIYAMLTDRSYWLPKKTCLYFLFPIAFISWMTLAGILAVNPTLSFWSSLSRGTGLLTIYHCLALSFVIASLIRRNGKAYIYKLLQWFIWGGFILALSVWFGSGGFHLPYQFLQTDGGGGMTGNSSVAAAYLLFIVFFGAFLLTVKEISNKKKWWIGWVMSVILFSPIFINIYGLFNGGSLIGNARGALLGIIVGFGATGVGMLCLSNKKIIRGLGIASIFLSIVVFSLGWKSLVVPGTNLHQKFTEVASGTRFIFWDTAQKVMNEHPWFGYGPENQMIAFQSHLNPKMFLPEYNHEVYTDRYHNIYYDIGASAGYPVIVFYTIFLLSIIYALYELKKKEIFSALQSSILFGLIIGYVFQNLFFFDSVLSLMILFAFAGIIYASFGFSLKGNNKVINIDIFSKNIIAFVLVILCSFSLVYFSYKPAKKLSIFKEVFAKQVNKPFNKLVGVSPVGDAYDIGGLAKDTFKSISVSAMAIKSNKEVLPYVQMDLTNFLKYLETVADKNPNDFRLYISIINLYSTEIFLSDKGNDTVLNNHMFALLEHARMLSPNNLEVYWSMAQVYAYKGDLKGIEESYKQAILIDSTIPASHQFLIQFAQKTGNQKLYNEALAQAKKDIPGFVLSN